MRVALEALSTPPAASERVMLARHIINRLAYATPEQVIAIRRDIDTRLRDLLSQLLPDLTLPDLHDLARA
jgi:hypothetical protein